MSSCIKLDTNRFICIMQSFPPTIVLRHHRENLKKCSLRGLEVRADFTFIKYPGSVLRDLSGYVILAMDGPPLSVEDSASGLFILDGTWRYAAKMQGFVDANSKMPRRSLPCGIRTAYPRRQEDCEDPQRGLASIEAIYAAYHILGRDLSGLLDAYHWKNEFLMKNNFS